MCVSQRGSIPIKDSTCEATDCLESELLLGNPGSALAGLLAQTRPLSFEAKRVLRFN